MLRTKLHGIASLSMTSSGGSRAQATTLPRTLTAVQSNLAGKPTQLRASFHPSHSTATSIGVTASGRPTQIYSRALSTTSSAPPRSGTTGKKPSPGPRTGKAITTSILLSAAIGTMLGFGLAKSSLLGDGARVNKNDVDDDEPRFGSPEEFAQAIVELKNTFPEGSSNVTVADDPDELHTHGFSENDHHPGE